MELPLKLLKLKEKADRQDSRDPYARRDIVNLRVSRIYFKEKHKEISEYVDLLLKELDEYLEMKRLTGIEYEILNRKINLVEEKENDR